MQLFNTILIAIIFLETTFLTVKLAKKRIAKGSRHARRRVFVDTSTLMDGRILSVARAGFLGDELLIPRSVIRELQLLADGQDSEKRSRARYGLDVVNQLERVEQAEASVFADEAGSRIKVDERLLELAKEHDAYILTNDFNLAKVAATEDIVALNINDLAQGLRSEYLPGDHMNVQIVTAGSNPKQGVAYLPDGTMVVVDDGEKYVGENFPVEIEFIRYLQTNAGKMMFARIAPSSEKAKSKKVKGRKPAAPAEAPQAEGKKAKKSKATKATKTEDEVPAASAEQKSVEAATKVDAEKPKKANKKSEKKAAEPKAKASDAKKAQGSKAKSQNQPKVDAKTKTKTNSDAKSKATQPAKKKRRKKTSSAKAEDSLLEAIKEQ